MLHGSSRLWRSQRGIGAIEFALVAPVLLAIILGILDFGIAYWEKLEVYGAADAGTQWGMTNGYDATSITNVVIGSTNLHLAGTNISPSNPCGCATSTGVSLDPKCTTCPDGTAPHQYILVNVHICYSTLFHWPGLNYCSSSSSNCTGCSPKQIALTGQSLVLQQ